MFGWVLVKYCKPPIVLLYLIGSSSSSPSFKESCWLVIEGDGQDYEVVGIGGAKTMEMKKEWKKGCLGVTQGLLDE